MSRIQAQARVQRENPRIDSYSATAPTAEMLQRIPGLNHATAAFGAYMPDSDAAEKAHDFYETLDVVGEVNAPRPKAFNPVTGAVTSWEAWPRIQRTAPISEREIDLVLAAKEAALQMKNDQYWTAQIDPALPWTLTEVTKVRPDILEKRLNAIKQLSQYTLDYEILRHLGHGGDPRLAELQYMIDQGMMDHMPKSMLVENQLQQFAAGKYSIWNVTKPGTDSVSGTRFGDNRLNLARTGIDPRYVGLDAAAVPHLAGANRDLSQTFANLVMQNHTKATTVGL